MSCMRVRYRLTLRSGRRLRHVVTGAGSRFVPLIADIDADPAECPVHPGIARPIADLVLRPQFLANIHETGGEVLVFERTEQLSAGLDRKLLHGLVAAFLLLRTEERR